MTRGQHDEIAEVTAADGPREAVPAMPAAGGTGQPEAEWRLVAERGRLSAVLSALRAGVLLEDDRGRVVTVNDEFLGMFGHPGSAGELVGVRREAVFGRIAGSFVDPIGFRDRAGQIAAGGLRVGGEELELAGERTVELDFVPIPGSGAVWQFRDVTDRTLVRLGNKFVATVSHELRTPLTSVVSFAHMLADPANGQLTPDQHKAVEVIERNAGRLLRLIEDLLLVVKLESRSLPLQIAEVDLAELVHTCGADRTPAAVAAGVSLTCTATAGPPRHADELRIQQVLDNLIGNALKFTPAGGSVTVSAIPADNGWWLTVRDTGVGVPTEELDRLFTTFARGSNAVRLGVPGTGLGLVIVRAIVGLHGGQIDLTSNEGGGTSVTVWLPCQLATDQQAGQ
ncbi:MAG: PAS domain-containing sensor histidine kinase [Actinobacteria bacterium]|nr:PAS domain-containing sensor histidine kinase [Actinomycetota bacterium]